MMISGAAEEDGDAPDLRGAYGLDGAAMMAVLAQQRGVFVGGRLQLPAEMRIEGGREGVAHGLVSEARRGVVRWIRVGGE